MLGKLVIRAGELTPRLTRPALRQYLRRVGWVPPSARWVVRELQRSLVPSPSTRTVGIGSGQRLEIDLANAMGREIYYQGAHEPEIDDFLRRFIKPGMTVFDVGANVGEVTAMAGRLVGPTGRVYAMEVSPRTLPRLRRNIELNRLDHVEVVQAAVCDRDEPVTFFLGGGHDSGSSSLTQPHDYSGESLTVPGIRLDSFAAGRGIERVDFIKMDIEGAELAALRGCSRLLAAPGAPALLFECHHTVAARMGWRLEDAQALLSGWGYTTRLASGGEPGSPKANVLALPPGCEAG